MPIPREIRFASDGECLAATLLLTDTPRPQPAVLLIGGTMSDTRDGDPALSLEGQLPRHGMLRVIAERLALAGIASLRWDKRGVGDSTGGNPDTHSDVWTDVADAQQALHTLAQQPEINNQRIAVLGESAGAYFTCFLAERTNLPAVYVLQGALYTDIVEMIRFNFQRTADFCARGPAETAWVKQVVPGTYKMAIHWQAHCAAARAGEPFYEGGQGSDYLYNCLRRRQQELAYPPAEQFQRIRRPVLVIQGDKDMNVPPGDCYQVAQALRDAGNTDVTLIVVPGADHSMQIAPDDDELRLRERISMESFSRPYSEFFLTSLTGWLSQQLRP